MFFSAKNPAALFFPFPQNDRKIKFSIFRKTTGKKYIPFRRTPESLQEIPIYIGMETRRNFAKKRRHSRESGNLLRAINFGISANFTRKLSLEFPCVFLQKRGECGDLSVKMDSRFRGNDEVNAGIPAENKIFHSRKTTGKKYIPFRRTPESLQEIPIYIGMETRRNSAKKRRHSRESGNPFGAINFGISAK